MKETSKYKIPQEMQRSILNFFLNSSISEEIKSSIEKKRGKIEDEKKTKQK